MFARDIIHVGASDRTANLGVQRRHTIQKGMVRHSGEDRRSVRQFRARAKCCQAIFLASASECRRFPSRSVLSAGAYRCVLAVGKYTLFHPPGSGRSSSFSPPGPSSCIPRASPSASPRRANHNCDYNSQL